MKIQHSEEPQYLGLRFRISADRMPSDGRDLLSQEEEQNLMCDYSLHAIASRPARVGEALVSTHFRGSATLGFASPAEKTVAVCLLPGTELAFETNVRYRGRWFKSHSINFDVAKFCKIPPEVLCQHHNALAFPQWKNSFSKLDAPGQPCLGP